MIRVLALATLVLAPAPALAGPVRVRLVNGTTGAPATVELLTLYRLGEGMEPVASATSAGPEAVLEAPDEGAARPWLLQATHLGVNYNQPVRLGPDGSADVELTVYDTFDAWSAPEIGLTTWRALYRRLPRSSGDALRVDHILVVENRSDPPRTFVSDEETLRFRLPEEPARRGLPSVSATGATGMPVPQSPFPVGDDGSWAVRTAFKPGETEVLLNYEVSYEGERHEAQLVAPRDSPEVMLLASPPDIFLELPPGAPPGWEILGPDDAAGLTAARKFDVAAGEAVRLVFRGGSTPAEAGDIGRGGALPPVETPAPDGSQVGTVGRLPDPTLASKWAIALLMAAALGFGLLHRSLSGPGGASGSRARAANEADSGGNAGS